MSTPLNPSLRLDSPILRVGILLTLCLLLGLIVWQAAFFSRSQALSELERKVDADLTRYLISVQQKLDRYKDLPQLLSTFSDMASILPYPETEAERLRVNQMLEQMNRILGATDTYLMNSEGLTIAASNWGLPHSFVGGNFSFRPYFQIAMQGRAGQYFALGTTSLQRGYFFTYPIYAEDEIVGVVALKIDVNDVEDYWSDPLQDILVTDEDEVIFVSTRPEWKFRTLRPLSAADLQRIQASQRYINQTLEPLALTQRVSLSAHKQIIELLEPSATRGQAMEARGAESYLKMTRAIPDTDLQVSILANLRPVEQKMVLAALQAALVYLLICLSAWIVWSRYRLRLEREAYQLREHRALESRVEERTRDLRETNERLLEEIQRHENTQNELIQTAKMAVLGQMAAGINHELNQPLTAIRHYADNAREFLERNRLQPVSENLQEISALTERMAKIIHPLKEFSRKSAGENEILCLKAVRDGAMSILSGRLRKEEVEVSWPERLEEVYVLGDTLRLEQVFVNLLTNASHAMDALPTKRIEVHLSEDAEYYWVHFRDFGQGIQELERIFEPFYTTKAVGQGLGLGLPISQRIVNSLQGELRAINHPEGGAVFSLGLRKAVMPE
ncbi:ATP-binding protein [Nitrincola tapanii]|uniref:C4-dicarboxylate transport sensor protein DctB n=1 Tax=Nitrincola tapanii TaxID=1708751 RepID=A0A5A9W226_9GAMM|nr:ATP-binding protein [Nitrincola tapanii]KAA0874777.1 sensor histidine kinase [Nitrincola tapanii]